MNTPSLRHTVLTALAIFTTIALTPRANAQDASDQALREIIEKQQAQLAAQQAQLEAQSKLLKTLQEQTQALATKVNKTEQSVAAVQQAAPPADPNATQVIRQGTGADPAISSVREGQVLNTDFSYSPASTVTRGLSNRGRHDLTSPTGTTVSYSDPAVVLRDPKTGTEVGIHGFAMFQALRDSDGMDNNEFDTFLIPVDGAPAQTKYSVNPSRIGIDSKTPLGWGRINTLVSLDLNGELGEPDWRLREAYGEFINDVRDYSFMAGQTYSTALDLQSVPETLDFAGPTGYYARRQPLVRYSKLFDHKVRLDIGADTPENATYLDADIQTQWPDLTVAGTWLADGDLISHLRLQGTIRDLRATDTLSGRGGSTTGWHLGFSGKINVPIFDDRDSFKFGVLYGDGFGGQLKSGPYDAAFNPTTLDLEKIGVFSSYGGFQHWWGEKLRSNFAFGMLNAENPSFMSGDRLESTYYLATNLVWNPFEHVTIGIEYLHGNRENIDGNSGDANRLLFSTKFDF